MISEFTAQSIGNKWSSYALGFFYSPPPAFNAGVHENHRNAVNLQCFIILKNFDDQQSFKLPVG